MRCWPVVRYAAAAGLAVTAGCARAPLAGPLAGVPVARGIPDSRLAPGHRRLLFRWEYKERVFSASGEGVARIAPPDSLRIDLFLENGNSGGFVILIADSLTAVAQDEARRSLPPEPMLWAALGVVRVAAPDTVAHVDGDTLRVDIGKPTAWRLAFTNESLVRLEHIRNQRIEELVQHRDSNRVVYRQPGAGRSLVLTIRQSIPSSGFDAAIWRP